MIRNILGVVVVIGVTAAGAHAGVDYATTERGGRVQSGGRMRVWDSLRLGQIIMHENNAVDPQDVVTPPGMADGLTGQQPGNLKNAGYLIFGPGSARLTFDRMADKYVVQAIIYDENDGVGPGESYPEPPIAARPLLPGTFDASAGSSGSSPLGAASAITPLGSPSPPDQPTPPPPLGPTVPLPVMVWPGLVALAGLGAATTSGAAAVGQRCAREQASAPSMGPHWA